MVSLSLFRTLLNLSCEDVLLQLVLRYLVPCNHVMLSQKPAVRDVDLYGRAADKFLSLIPRCCRHRAPSPPRPEHASWARGGPSREAGRREDTTGPGSPSVDSSSVVTVPRPSTPSRLALFLRQQSLGGSEAPAPAPRSPGLAASPASSPGRRPSPAEEPGELEDNYLEYLREARRGVDRCVQACRAWSAPYDGERPPPEPSPLGSRTKKRSLLAEEDGDNAGEGEEEELGGGGLAGGAREGPGHLPPPQLNGVPGPWPEGAKKVRRVPQEGAGELPEGTPEAVAGLEGFGQELRELEVALSNGGAGSEPSLEPSLPLEEEEAYESFACPPEPPGPFLSSPLRTLNQLPSQPFTGKPRSPGLLLWALFACSRRVCAGLQTSWPRHACVLAPLLIRLLGSPPDTRHVPLVSPCLSVHLPCLCWFVVTEGQALRVCPVLCPVRMILLPGLAASWDV